MKYKLLSVGLLAATTLGILCSSGSASTETHRSAQPSLIAAQPGASLVLNQPSNSMAIAIKGLAATTQMPEPGIAVPLLVLGVTSVMSARKSWSKA